MLLLLQWCSVELTYALSYAHWDVVSACVHIYCCHGATCCRHVNVIYRWDMVSMVMGYNKADHMYFHIVLERSLLGPTPEVQFITSLYVVLFLV